MTATTEAVPADVAALFAATSKFNADQQKKIRTVYRRLRSPEFKEMFDNVEKWREENDGLEKAIPTTMVAKEMEKPRDTFMLIRGEYDKKGDKVDRGCSGHSSAVAEGSADQPPRLCALAVAAGPSAHGARDRESFLAAIFWHRPGEDDGRLRRAGRQSFAS